MVIVKLKGELGQQLFQYAFGRALAARKNVPLRLDPITGFQEQPGQCHYALHPLQIQENFASVQEMRPYLEDEDPLGLSPAPALTGVVFEEKESLRYQFDPEVLNTPEDVYAWGEWQNEAYFSNLAATLRREFIVRPLSRDRNNKYWEQRIKGAQAVAVDLRQPVEGEDRAEAWTAFYQQALERILQRVPRAELFVFCEDADWAKAHLKVSAPMSFVSGNAGDNTFETLRLMGLCRHQIISGSPLSWWAAWLGERPGQVVLVPPACCWDPAQARDPMFPERWTRVTPAEPETVPPLAPEILSFQMPLAPEPAPSAPEDLAALFAQSAGPTDSLEALHLVLQAEEKIAQMSDPDFARLRERLQAAPEDKHLQLWSGLVLEARGQYQAACEAYGKSLRLGEHHWRLSWYVARVARALGLVGLVDQACAAVLKANPQFWYARELPKHARGYYAQLDQDKFIEKYFETHPTSTRTFVEVGAFDGVHYSNVRRLQERYGWQGLSVEPVGKNFAKLSRSYRGKPVKCVQAAVADTEGEMEMNVSIYPHLPDWGSDVASLTAEGTERWQRQYGAQWHKEKVTVKKLTTILEEAGLGPIDVLSVDAEGHDLGVLKSLDFDRFAPQLIVVEYGEERQPIAQFLQSKGYQLQQDNGQDLIAVRPRPQPAPGSVSKEDWPSRVNPHLFEIGFLSRNDQPELRVGSALDLVTPQRFDIPAKTIYARQRQLGVECDWARRLYHDHIRAFSGEACREGDGSKNCIEDYLKSFDDLLESVGSGGFDPQRTLVPVGNDGVIIDGGHRVASCVAFNKPLGMLRFGLRANAYPSAWFQSRGLALKWRDAIALEYARLRPDTYVVMVYPAAQGKHAEVQAILAELGQIVYEKPVELNRQGSFNLIRQVYAGEKWLGDWTNQFAGAWGKANPCFAQPGPLRVFLFQCASLEKVLNAKKRIRDLFGIENHSVHINDTHEQTLLLGGIFFNENSLHFLNHGRAQFFAGFEQQIRLYTDWLRHKGYDPEKFCIDGSAVLAAYGLRDSADLDILHFEPADFSSVLPLVNSHNSEVHHHVVSRDDIIFNPENHFYFCGVKFASLDVIRRLKVKRGEPKDRTDVQLIDSLAQPSAAAAVAGAAKLPRIVGLVPARNEASRIAYCLRALARYTDAIVYLDDFSEDNTVEIVESLRRECKVERILRKTSWHRDEPGDRNALLRAGREIGGTHFIVLDADEVFTANCQDGQFLRRHILALPPGGQLALNWIQLWRGIEFYRFDNSVWTWNMKIFAFCDDGRCGYQSEFIHTPRVPANLDGPRRVLRGYDWGVLHFQFANWRNLLVKQAWYRCLERIRDPQKPSADINERYAPSKDERGLGLKRCPKNWFEGYHAFFEPAMLEAPDSWREKQVLGWFEQFGRDRFQDLDIWDVSWGQGQQVCAPSPEFAAAATLANQQRSLGQRLASQLEQPAMLYVAPQLGFADSKAAAAEAGVGGLLDEAYGLLLRGETAQAEAVWARLPAGQDKDAALLIKKAAVAILLGRVEEFEAALSQALASNSENPQALRLLVDLNLKEGKALDAAKLCARLLRQAPDDVAVLNTLGFCLLCLGELQTARDTYQRIVSLEPANQPAVRTLETLQAEGQPLVSAIISTYKSERFIRGCLEDLVCQTLFQRGQLEIVVVDSCSPQNERAVVEEFQRRYPNILYIRSQERETVYGAWNRGIKASHGKFLTNANTDDRHRCDALEILARTLEQRADITVAYADCLITRIENETFENAHVVGKYQWLEFSPRALLEKGCFLGPQPMWRREVHEEHGYFDAEMVSAGDYEFWLRIARNRKCLHVREFLGLYLESPTSVEHANREVGNQEVVRAQGRYAKDLLAAEKSSAAGRKGLLPSKPSAPRPTPACALIGDLAAARQALAGKDYPKAWTAVLQAVEARPYHPEGYLLLGEIALAAGAGSEARQCAQHARQQAPQWKKAQAFLKKSFQAGKRPDWLALPPAIQTPAAPRLTVCLIARNEERFLAQCLRSVKPIASQIVVVDTGSTDRTVQIARELGAEVHEFTWCDDFSAPRNVALEHARGDWILVLDADEELPANQHPRLLEELKNLAKLAYRVPLVNHGKEAEGFAYVPRLYRNLPGACYQGRIHEQIFPSLLAACKEFEMGSDLGKAVIVHYGYSKEMTLDRNKVERNLALLRKAVQEDPRDCNIVMNLGLELVRSGQLEEGIEYYREAYRLMSEQPPAQVVPELREVLLTQYAAHLYRVRAFQETVQILNSPLAHNGGLTPSLCFALGLACFELKDYPSAVEQLRSCLKRRQEKSLSPVNTDILGSKPIHCLAVSLTRLEEFEEAEKMFKDGLAEAGASQELRMDYGRFLFERSRSVEALQQLHEIVKTNAGHLAAWQLGGQIALSQPQFLEFAADWTEEAMRQVPEDAVVQAERAEVLLLGQKFSEARPLWEQLNGRVRHPRSLAALVLCEMLEGPVSTRPADAVELAAVSRAFVEWYRKLVNLGAKEAILRINNSLDRLEPVLPEVAGIFKKIAAEAAASAAPCAV